MVVGPQVRGYPSGRVRVCSSDTFGLIPWSGSTIAMQYRTIAELLNKIAALQEIQRQSVARVAACWEAAWHIEGLGEPNESKCVEYC
jgi:hypothetical protein